MMKADFFYTTSFGRALFLLIQKSGGFRLASRFLHTRASARMIPRFIRNNQIDMTPFEGQSFRTYADFFARAYERALPESADSDLISPCDSLLSIYPVDPDLAVPMKGSVYHLPDLIPEREIAALFSGGLCLVFRLQASDYHHFLCFDDAELSETRFIEGMLHSVQPKALEACPVFRLNRRWWRVLSTAHFGTAVQAEVGAMAVGGVTLEKEKGPLLRGEEMGHFELAGSTILVFLTQQVRETLTFADACQNARETGTEVPVRMGEVLGSLK